MQSRAVSHTFCTPHCALFLVDLPAEPIRAKLQIVALFMETPFLVDIAIIVYTINK